MTALVWIYASAIFVVCLCCAVITACALWFSSKMLRDMASASHDDVMFRARLQQEGLDAIIRRHSEYAL